ncbi:MAG: DUF72 domain-containing protein [Isosphaeraceae bacterium]|nr:DUF72 domain-containing protein [Isosphaeraceae bacterium]
MSLFPSFEEAEDKPALAQRLAPKLHTLAEQGVYFGASSWKYDGWLGSIYSPGRYTTRGKFSQSKFERECLAEYAATFPTVCGDFAFYQFPTRDYWHRLFGETPDAFTFGLKVPEDITVLRWPGHARYGKRAGRPNEHFLDADVFRRLFLDALAPYRTRVGPLIFEFGTFAKQDFAEAATFFDHLGAFLGALPAGWRYAVEIRNAEYLLPAYFDVLGSRNVAHVFNAWTRMPALGDQVRLADAFTADFTVVRALLAKGRSYEQAVKAFQPYRAIREPNEDARAGMGQVARRAAKKKEPAFLYVNNRLEGFSPGTIEAVADGLS